MSRRLLTRTAVALLLTGPLVGTPQQLPRAGADLAPPITAGSAVPAVEWTALFDRESGWTGADGIYSVPLDGDERPDGDSAATFFTFSDTFVGDVRPDGSRAPGSTLVNNSNAVLRGTTPDPAQLTFTVRRTDNGTPVAQVVPRPTADTWFWPADGVTVGERTFLYSLRMRSAPGGPFGFAVDGISLLATPTASRPLFGQYRQSDLALYRPAGAGRGESFYGMAVMPDTTAAHAPAPDGYLYVYGLQNDRNNKRLLVARVRPAQIADRTAYRFWDGSVWSDDITGARPMTGRLSSEFSVSPLADGRYLLVFQLDGLSAQTAVRYAPTPVGPWSDYQVVYTAPESGTTPEVYTYNAKAHPHLSEPDRLLVSYNVNTLDFAQNLAVADIYRPRFIWVPLAPTS